MYALYVHRGRKFTSSIGILQARRNAYGFLLKQLWPGEAHSQNFSLNFSIEKFLH